ncbi:5-guanidino-2-oxopentanoate decarboxylase [Profundibacter sp.]
MSKRPLGANISHMLKARGVDVIFGIPGVHNIELYRGIEEAGISHVLARHEQGAGFMADGYARATGKVGVAYVITGPGLCNIMTPMGQAYSDSVPMLVISSCLETKDTGMGRGRLHEMRDQEAAAATVCDWSMTAPDAPAAYRLVDKAFMEFSSKRARPKHIQVPIDVLGSMADAPPDQPTPAAKPLARPEDIAAAAEWLLGAKRPMFVFGGGAAEGFEAARKLVRLMRAASMCSFAGRGIIAPDYPLNYGPCLSKADSAAELAKADLVLCIGTELSETDLWRDQLGYGAPMIRVDLDAHSLADDHVADLPIMGDAAAFLSDLCDLVEGHNKVTEWSAAEVAVAKSAFAEEADAARQGIAPICAAMAEALPKGTLIYSDMTQFAYVSKELYPLDRPNLWHHPYGFGALGYGLPAAIGGKIGRPNTPVVAIAGDYGFHYTMQELGVAVELGLSLPIILWDNGKLKEIEDSMVASQIAPNAVIARNPDFCALARAFGAGAVAPETLADFQKALKDALKADGPTLIHVTPQITG